MLFTDLVYAFGGNHEEEDSGTPTGFRVSDNLWNTKGEPSRSKTSGGNGSSRKSTTTFETRKSKTRRIECLSKGGWKAYTEPNFESKLEEFIDFAFTKGLQRRARKKKCEKEKIIEGVDCDTRIREANYDPAPEPKKNLIYEVAKYIGKQLSTDEQIS